LSRKKPELSLAFAGWTKLADERRGAARDALALWRSCLRRRAELKPPLFNVKSGNRLSCLTSLATGLDKQAGPRTWRNTGRLLHLFHQQRSRRKNWLAALAQSRGAPAIRGRRTPTGAGDLSLASPPRITSPPPVASASTRWTDAAYPRPRAPVSRGSSRCDTGCGLTAYIRAIRANAIELGVSCIYGPLIVAARVLRPRHRTVCDGQSPAAEAGSCCISISGRGSATVRHGRGLSDDWPRESDWGGRFTS